MGISYGGISQLFTGRRPSRRAWPRSRRSRCIDSTQTTLYPGGILNTGLRARVGEGAGPRRRCRPSPDGGQAWAYKRIQEGDEICADNQALHAEAARPAEEGQAPTTTTSRRSPTRSRRSPSSTRSRCPTFMACQWTDEQTGGHCPTLAEHFTGTDRKWFTFTNGTHVDSLDPETFNRWYDFLKLYVAEQAPISQLGADPGRRAGDLPGGDGHHRRDPAARPDPAAADLRRRRYAAFEAADAGPRSSSTTAPAGPSPASPYPGFEQSFAEFPVPGHQGRILVPAPRRRRSRDDAARAGQAPTAFNWDPDARPPTDFTGDTAAGHGRPLDRDAHLQLGPAARRAPRSPTSPRRSPSDTTVDRRRRACKLWVRSSTPERRPAGDGHARSGPTARRPSSRAAGCAANERKLDAQKSTPLEPVLSLRESRRRAAAARPLRPRSRSRSTTRATPTGPARGSG